MKRLLVLMIVLGLVNGFVVSAQDSRVPLTPQNATSITMLKQLGNGTADDLSWAPDGTLVIAGGRGIWFYDPTDPDEPLYTIDRDSLPIQRVAYSPSGELLAWCASGKLTVSNMTTGMILWENDTPCNQDMAFSPDSTLLATMDGSEMAKIWDAATGRLDYELSNPGGTKSMAFIPNGVLVTGDWEGIAHWWNTRTGTEIRSTPGMADIIAVSPDGALVATTENMSGEIILWDANTGQQVSTLQGWVKNFLFVPGHKLLGINNDGGFALWDADTGESVFNEYHETLARCYSPTISPDWQTLALDCPNGVTLLDMSNRETAHVLDAFSGVPDALAFSPDGTLLASSYFLNPVARLWHVGYGRLLASLWTGTANAYDVVFSPDGSLLGTPTQNGMMQWWRTNNGAPAAVLRPDESSYWDAALSPDGTILAVARWKTTGSPALLQLWDAAGETLVYELSLGEGEGWISDMAFNPDGSQLAVIVETMLYLIDPYQGTIQQTLGPSEASLVSLAFSGDGGILAYIESSLFGVDTVHLWNTGFGVEMGTLTPHCGNPDDSWTVAISPVSNLTATGCRDGSIELWNIADGTQIETLYGHYSTINSLVFNADSSLLASGSWDGTIMLWGIP